MNCVTLGKTRPSLSLCLLIYRIKEVTLKMPGTAIWGTCTVVISLAGADQQGFSGQTAWV